MRRCVYAGSFDPPTNGHLWMIEQGAGLFDELIVAVGTNPDKKYTFSLEERLEMLRRMLRGNDATRLEHYEQRFLVDCARDCGASYILRGIRSSADYEYERGMRHINEDLAPGLQTVFLMPPRGMAEVSSSMVKGLIGPQGWEDLVSRYVPASVYSALVHTYSGYRQEWLELWQGLGLQGDGVREYEELRLMYREPERRHHALDHIIQGLQVLKEIRLPLENPLALLMSWWLHDSKYKPGDKNHEALGVAYAKGLLGAAGAAPNLLRMVSELMMATRHDEAEHAGDGRVIADLDLWILGSEKKRFWVYEHDIREEYGCVGDQQYRMGRAEFALGMLERERIFHTDLMHERFDDAARQNLRDLIDYLDCPKRVGCDHDGEDALPGPFGDFFV